LAGFSNGLGGASICCPPAVPNAVFDRQILTSRLLKGSSRVVSVKTPTPRGHIWRVSQLDEILNNADYFYCKKAGCTLRIVSCIQRQKANKKRRSFVPLSFPICVGCAQGAENRLITKQGASMSKNPRPGAGFRLMDCEHYEICLDLAAKKDWESFNCESCTSQRTGQNKEPVQIEETENVRLCEDCGKKATISPKHKLCASCMAKRSQKGRSVKKEAKSKRQRGRPRKKRPTESPTEAPKNENLTQYMFVSEKARVGPNTALTIEFGKYSPILRAIEELAEEEMRPVSLQVVYILKHYIDGRQAEPQTET
jgi:ribosomal protein L37E